MLTHPSEGTAPSRSADGTWHLSFTLNGERVETEVPPTTTLLDVLRLHLGRTGSKGACLEGECGSCTVLVNGVPQNSCLILAPQAEGTDITSVEGLATGDTLDSVQQAFLDCGAVQCGYCTPGLLIAARAFIDSCDHVPSVDEVRRGMEGNICRCTGYMKVIDAVITAALVDQQEGR
jgi:carbon-monoxide dehydrogenase small subunit